MTMVDLPPPEEETPSVRITAGPTMVLFEDDNGNGGAAFAGAAAAAAAGVDSADDGVAAAGAGGAGGLSSSPPGAAAGASPSSGGGNDNGGKTDSTVATLSSPWQYDDEMNQCTGCDCEFTALNRKHHCRLCGKIYCHSCSRQRALIPPSSIVLVPKGGKKVKSKFHHHHHVMNAGSGGANAVGGSGDSQSGAGSDAYTSFSFSPDQDPDRMLTYLSSGESKELLYGKGLEERFKLAREPLRVCAKCHRQLQPLQEELRSKNSNAMRFNSIDPTDPRRLFNSPLAFTLGHEIRKAAYALNNLLPLPKRQKMGAFVPVTDNFNPNSSAFGTELQHCRDGCLAISPNMSNLDGVRIPAKLLQQAKGIAVITVVKGGFGLAGLEFGTGLVVARRSGGHASPSGSRQHFSSGPGGSGGASAASAGSASSSTWSAPCAIGTAGMSWGALLGAQVSDHVFLLMTDAAVEMMFSDKGSVQLGADVGVAVGPVGRAVEADVGASANRNGAVAPIYTYSMSKGLYAGVSLDGKVIVTRDNVNEKFYGQSVTAREILYGAVPVPPAAQPLYEALARCHVYAATMGNQGGAKARRELQEQQKMQLLQQQRMQQQQHQQQFRYYEDHFQNANEVGNNGNNNNNNAERTTMDEYGEIVAEGYMVGQPVPPPSAFQHRHNPYHPPANADEHSYAGMSRMSDITSDPGY